MKIGFGRSNWALVLVTVCLVLSFGGCKKKVPPPDVTPTDDPKPQKLSVFTIRPNQGKTDAATAVTITGAGFKTGLTVSIGDSLASELVVNNPETLRASVPAGLNAGSYDVIIKAKDGEESRLRDAFTVSAPSTDSGAVKTVDCKLEAIYFDFDMSALNDEGRSTLQRNADCMKARKVKRVQVEGHTDERGSNDYNIALGDRRASEAARYLEKLGLSNVTTLSYGEEKPATTGGDEETWTQNRRAEIKVLE